MLARLAVVLLVLGIALSGCAKKPEAPKITGSSTYTDSVINFSIKHPSGWIVRKEMGQRLQVFSSNDIIPRFTSLYSYKEDDPKKVGARIFVAAIKPNGKTIDELAYNAQEFDSTAYKMQTRTTVDGAPAIRMEYSFAFNGGTYDGFKYVIMADSSMATVVDFSAFGGSMAMYKTEFESYVREMKIARETPKKIDTVIQAKEPEPPSSTLRAVSGTGFSISVPENFRGGRTQNSGTLYSSSFSGDRIDCTIQVDVIDASKSKNLDKIVSDNLKVYRAASASPTSIGGNKASYINYSFVKDVQSRVYFTIKGDKMYRITLNWFQPQKDVYLPIFEKCVASFRAE